RIRRIDDGSQFTPFHQFQALEQVAPASHVRAGNHDLLSEEKPQIDFHLGTSRAAAGYDPAVPRQRLERGGEKRWSDMFEHDIHAAAFVQLANSLHNTVVVVIDKIVAP